ncbi:MAG: alkene reductase [Alphaproteobacteria bacterium]|nr:alkene reductase [Alphaproteobacteria bacterium]MCD8525859.1 alkene reductase [Alphaproteobacteria bacterium]MCD8570859.1 alkene reductase [Alphaproteobacteria bacterium]
MTTLFDPVSLGDIKLSNRIVMAPLTRGRAGETRIPNDLMVEYYRQRAGAGLIITEATAISAQGYGWPGAPALYTDEHEAGWKKVVDAVYAEGGKIVLQMWHMGRVVDESLIPEGEKSVGPSAIAAGENIRRASGKSYPTPRALEADELPGIIEDYVRGAERAIRAGFDGVEVHNANGYLLDQFLRDGSNKRSDAYGGSIENRMRFPLEVVRAVCDAIGPGKVGVRVSPTNKFNDMSDSDPVALFTAYAEALNPLNLAYLHVMEPNHKEHFMANPDLPYVTPHIHDAYKGKLMVNGGYTADEGEKALEEHAADAVAYGVLFIANPDLVERFKQGAPLNAPDQSTFYTPGAKGYTDYPSLKEKAA